MIDFNDSSLKNPLAAFIDQIEKAGLGRPELFGSGEIERFDTPDCKRGDKAGWAVFYSEDGFAAGAFGSWRNGGKHTWSSHNGPEAVKKMAEAVKKGVDVRLRLHGEARKKANDLWDRSPEAKGDHPYLVRKGVKVHGIRQDRDQLLIPMRDIKGVIHSLQEIYPDGKKKNLPDGAVTGHFHTIFGDKKITYLCEGYATGASIHAATGSRVIVSFDRNNLVAVSKILTDQRPAGATTGYDRLVVAADNDHKTNGNPGLKAARDTGLPYVFPEGIQGTDFNDMALEKGLDAVRLRLCPPKSKFEKRLICSDQLHDKFEESLRLSFLIKDILPESSGLVLIYGAPGSFKSFSALDIALSIATGKDWHNHQVKSCPVLYLAAEGQSGVLKRIEAWRKYWGIELENFNLLPMPCLIDNPAELNELMDLMKIIRPRVIFLDTLARSMLGDENSTLDMGKVVIACDRIREEIGAMVILIHHTGKDETKGARGAIALTGATDTAFRILLKKEYRQFILFCERQKDYDPFFPMFFDLEEVDTEYQTIDGDPVLSLVPIYNPELNVKEGKKDNLPIRGAAAIALKALGVALKDFGIEPSEEIKNKMSMSMPGDKVVGIDSWRMTAYRMGISDGDKEAQKKAFKRSKEILLQKGLVKTFDGYYWEGDK
jgi:putative DNA primase/helicase